MTWPRMCIKSYILIDRLTNKSVKKKKKKYTRVNQCFLRTVEVLLWFTLHHSLSFILNGLSEKQADGLSRVNSDPWEQRTHHSGRDHEDFMKWFDKCNCLSCIDVIFCWNIKSYQRAHLHFSSLSQTRIQKSILMHRTHQIKHGPKATKHLFWFHWF